MTRVKQVGRWSLAFLCEQEGTVATEYAVLLAMIAVAAVASVAVLGHRVAGTATSVSTGLPFPSEVPLGGPGSTMSHVTTSTP